MELFIVFLIGLLSGLIVMKYFLHPKTQGTLYLYDSELYLELDSEHSELPKYQYVTFKISRK